MNRSAPVRFDAFMEHALHDPERGYYARRIRGIGRHGDFATAPALLPGFSHAIARWAAAALDATGCRDLIEIGPGDGTLAAAVMRLLPWRLRLRTRLRFVECSEPLAAMQRARFRQRATWHRHPLESLDACGGAAVIFSNELVDAFPVRCFRLGSDGWCELWLRWAPPAPPEEVWQPAEPLPHSSSFQQPHTLGQRIEVHESYRQWLAAWLPAWHAGRLLTIDYGAPAAALYHRRPHGTLRGYLMHQRLDGAACYLNPGRADLTADVNFTDLQDWAAPWARTLRLASLREFVMAAGLAPAAPPAPWLADPGPGDAFLALDQEPLLP
ncbi:MAG: SAM-dependent methyltransferase [Akkermansiaceae bacterium]|nr:SAM-dependent methyltransferase [Akkermansiaceae bacterium]